VSAPRYTSRNQFANMLDRRAQELAELAERMREHGGLDEAIECTYEGVDDLRVAAKWLRDPVK
jgi:hypothetical protein